MQAQRFICQTDTQGNLPSLPVLQPNCTIEVILLILEGSGIPNKPPRKPHPALAGKIIFKDDLTQPLSRDNRSGDESEEGRRGSRDVPQN